MKKQRQRRIFAIKQSIANIIVYLALHLAYYFWKYATKQNPDLGYACLDGLYKMSFTEPNKEGERVSD